MRTLFCAAVAILLSAQLTCAAARDPALDALIDKLVRQGVVSADEAKELRGKPPTDGEANEPRGKPPIDDEAKEPRGKPFTDDKANGPKEKPPGKLPVDIKVRAQARLDLGDLLVSPAGDYLTERDLFLRRVRLEVEKELKNLPFGKELELNLTLEADRAEQDFRNGRRRDAGNRVGIHYLYGDWIFDDAVGLEVGKHKIPILRVELTSSSRQLLIERPAVTGVAKDTLGDYQQAHVMLHGEPAAGALRYYLSLADGASSTEALQDLDPDATELQSRRFGKAFFARVELSPWGLAGRGWVEERRDDTGIGTGNHLTLGVDAGYQRNIRYATESVDDARVKGRVFSADLAGRYMLGSRGTVTGQFEYVQIRRDFNYRADEKPQGGYLQAGYLLPVKVLRGQLEPVLRYELFDHDRIEEEGRSGTKERSVTAGFNHYLMKHSIKWAYNFVRTRFDAGVAEAANSRNRDLHQLLLQLYF